MWQITETFLAHHAHIITIDGEYNNTHPLAFVAERFGPNSNTLSYGEALAAIYKVNFKESMNEEMEKCFDNNIYM